MSSLIDTGFKSFTDLLESAKSSIETVSAFRQIEEKVKWVLSFFLRHPTKLIFGGVAGLAAAYIIKIWREYGTFKRMGIETPEYRFFFGHLKDLEKTFLPQLHMCSDRFMSILDKQVGQSFKPHHFIKLYTMDLILNAAFGSDIDCQNDSENTFVTKAIQFMTSATDLRWNFVLATYFYELRNYIAAASFFITLICEKFTENSTLNDPFAWFFRNIIQVLEKRLANKISKKDYVSILFETLNESLDKNNDKKATQNIENVEKSLTLDEIKMNLVAFLLGGFETISTVLNYCFYALAKYPVQLAKLQDELDQRFNNNESEINYDSVAELEYMELFIREVLRMYPSANSTVARRCTNPTNINGINFPYNLTVVVDVKTLHFNPEYWGEDADNFNPLRFSSQAKRHPAAYLPFGLGPRLCVGMKFALLDIKMTLAKVLLKYDICATPKTPSELKFTEIGGFPIPSTPIVVEVKHRKYD